MKYYTFRELLAEYQTELQVHIIKFLGQYSWVALPPRLDLTVDLLKRLAEANLIHGAFGSEAEARNVAKNKN